jgi:hypothetical protein
MQNYQESRKTYNLLTKVFRNEIDRLKLIFVNSNVNSFVAKQGNRDCFRSKYLNQVRRT